MNFQRIGKRVSFCDIQDNKAECDIIIFAVEQNFKKDIVICGTKDKLKDFKSDIRCQVIVNIHCSGIQSSENVAHKVSSIIDRKRRHKWFLTSSNEYCVSELSVIKENIDGNWKIGVLSNGLPLGHFNHLNIEFVILEHTVIDSEVITYFHNVNVLVFSYLIDCKERIELLKTDHVDGLLSNLY